MEARFGMCCHFGSRRRRAAGRSDYWDELILRAFINGTFAVRQSLRTSCGGQPRSRSCTREWSRRSHSRQESAPTK